MGKIAHLGLDPLLDLSYSFKDVQMGLGDPVFYSMLSGIVRFNFGLISCLVLLAGILVGSLFTHGMLEKKGVFLGLPFPIFLGLVGELLASLTA